MFRFTLRFIGAAVIIALSKINLLDIIYFRKVEMDLSPSKADFNKWHKQEGTHPHTKTRTPVTDALPLNASSQAPEKKNYSCRLGNETVTFPLLPHFIIVGAQKAGTTALKDFLDMVPGLLGTKKREPHFWDLEAPKRAPYEHDAAPDWKCRQYRRYANHWNTRNIRNGTILFEKTPKLLALRYVPSMIAEVLPHTPKIIIILRNPIDRAYSGYKMAWQFSSEKRKNFPPFDHVVAKTVSYLRRKGVKVPVFDPNTTGMITWKDFSVLSPDMEAQLNFKNILLRGCYSRQIRNWMQHFDFGKSLKVIQYENLRRNQSAVLQDLLTFVGGTSHNIPETFLKSDHAPGRRRKAANPSFVPKIPFNSPWPLRNETATFLKYFYKPYNEELARLLGEDWRDIWD